MNNRFVCVTNFNFTSLYAYNFLITLHKVIPGKEFAWVFLFEIIKTRHLANNATISSSLIIIKLNINTRKKFKSTKKEESSLKKNFKKQF
jgi:hypothetical protein